MKKIKNTEMIIFFFEKKIRDWNIKNVIGDYFSYISDIWYINI